MTRENVASHLQKYRLYLKKIAGYQDKERIDPDVLQKIHECNVHHMAIQQSFHYNPHHPSAGMYGSPVGPEHDPCASGDNIFASFGAFPATLGSAKQALAQMRSSSGATLHAASVPAGEGDRSLEGMDDDCGSIEGRTADPYSSTGIADVVPMVDRVISPNQGVISPEMHASAAHAGPGTALAPSGAPVPSDRPVSPTVTKAINNGGHFDPQQGWQYPPLPQQHMARSDPLQTNRKLDVDPEHSDILPLVGSLTHEHRLQYDTMPPVCSSIEMTHNIQNLSM